MATKNRSDRTSAPEFLTVDDVLAELQIPRRTWQRWRELGTGPECIRLPNRDLRIRRTALNNWLESLKEAA
ncbi:helix-turn-helix domain-containing protein [Kineosporia babensis]